MYAEPLPHDPPLQGELLHNIDTVPRPNKTVVQIVFRQIRLVYITIVRVCVFVLPVYVSGWMSSGCHKIIVSKPFPF